MTPTVVIYLADPFVGIEPILAVPGVRATLADCAAPVVAVSPLTAINEGPTAEVVANSA